jgi:hypothetical protein
MYENFQKEHLVTFWQWISSEKDGEQQALKENVQETCELGVLNINVTSIFTHQSIH